MRKFSDRLFVVLILVSAQNGLVKSNYWHRSRRFLTFPPTSPTRVQVHYIFNKIQIFQETQLFFLFEIIMKYFRLSVELVFLLIWSLNQ